MMKTWLWQINEKNEVLIDNEWVPLRNTWAMLGEDTFKQLAHQSEYQYWDRTTQYCGACGAKLIQHMDIGKKCPQCGMEHFPKISPAMIVRIVRKCEPYEALGRVFDEEILLVHSINFRRSNMHGLVAGYVECGETLEECVVREVQEEVGLRIKNIKYWGSQPWPFPSNLMVGFTADYESGDIHMDDGELTSAQWYRANELPEIPDKMSISRQLIEDWLC